jgi:serine/threonine protein kinase
MGSTQRSLPDGSFLGTDRFVIERQLGEGSMGAVYLAFDRERRARVALKTLRRVDASGIYRFKREFRALADVSHRNLVSLHELFSEGTDWFFTMEYVEGQDFISYALGETRRVHDASPHRTRELHMGGRTRAKGMEVLFPSPLKQPEHARDVLSQVTLGLMALHTAGQLHRDLKSDNVIITADGRAVIVDFGIAFELNPDQHSTLEGGVFGTPAYMSPEQAAGLPLSEAADWYSLGVMLYTSECYCSGSLSILTWKITFGKW